MIICDILFPSESLITEAQFSTYGIPTNKMKNTERVLMTAATAETPSTSVVEDPPFKKTEPMAYAMGDIGNGFYF